MKTTPLVNKMYLPQPSHFNESPREACIAACRREAAWPIESHRKSHQAGWAYVRTMTDDEIYAVAGGERNYSDTVKKMAKQFTTKGFTTQGTGKPAPGALTLWGNGESHEIQESRKDPRGN